MSQSLFGELTTGRGAARTPTMVSRVDTSDATLQAYGFTPTTYQGQQGTFMVTEIAVRWMPALSRQVDDDLIYLDSVALIEVTPERAIQLVIEDTGYMEEAMPLSSPQGAALLRDAMDGMLARSCAAASGEPAGH